MSQNKRKLVEERFGWGKVIGGLRQTVFRGLQRVEQEFQLTMAAGNLIRIRNLLGGACP